MNFLSRYWTRFKSYFVRGNVQETAFVPENKEEATTPNPQANPFNYYEIQKLIVKYVDHWTLHNLREVSHDYKYISMKRQLHITSVIVTMGNHKLKLQVYDQGQRNWIWVKYEKRGKRNIIRNGKEEELDICTNYETSFLDDFIRILKHRNTKLEEIAFDIDPIKFYDLKNNLSWQFSLQKKFKSLKGTVKARRFSMTLYRYPLGRGYRLANFLKLMKPGVLENIRLEFNGGRLNTQRADPLDEHFSSINRSDQWMQATRLNCQNFSYTPRHNWAHFETVQFSELKVWHVCAIVKAFTIIPPSPRCTINVYEPIDVIGIQQFIHNIDIEAADDNRYTIPLNDGRFLVVHIEEYSITVSVNVINED